MGWFYVSLCSPFPAGVFGGFLFCGLVLLSWVPPSFLFSFWFCSFFLFFGAWFGLVCWFWFVVVGLVCALTIYITLGGAFLFPHCCGYLVGSTFCFLVVLLFVVLPTLAAGCFVSPLR